MKQLELPLEFDEHPGHWRVSIRYLYSPHLNRTVWYAYKDKSIAQKVLDEFAASLTSKSTSRHQPSVASMELDMEFRPNEDADYWVEWVELVKR